MVSTTSAQTSQLWSCFHVLRYWEGATAFRLNTSCAETYVAFGVNQMQQCGLRQWVDVKVQLLLLWLVLVCSTCPRRWPDKHIYGTLSWRNMHTLSLLQCFLGKVLLFVFAPPKQASPRSVWWQCMSHPGQLTLPLSLYYKYLVDDDILTYDYTINKTTLESLF